MAAVFTEPMDVLADRMVQIAVETYSVARRVFVPELQRSLILQPDVRILETSNGRGQLVESLRRFGVSGEQLSVLARVSRDVWEPWVESGVAVRARDLFDWLPSESGLFRLILVKPPLVDLQQSMGYVYHATRFLQPGGVLTALLPNSWRTTEQPICYSLRRVLTRASFAWSKLPADMQLPGLAEPLGIFSFVSPNL